MNERTDQRDELAWHLLAASVDGCLLGAIRIRIYDCRVNCPSVEKLLAYSDVRISYPSEFPTS